MWLLHDAGAKLVVADIDETRAEAMAKAYGATVVSVDRIHQEAVDVFAPCALGAILNDKTIPELKAKVVAGGANNQLADEGKHGKMLGECGILYAPDYVINAGGVINIFHELKGYNETAAKAQAANIYNTLLDVFQTAETKKISTHQASDALAEQRIAAVRQTTQLRQTFDNQLWIRR